jgi:hypothetical protein
VLADFDTAFFDLQDDGDEYQDNPTHYMLRDKGVDATLGARYPPVSQDILRTISALIFTFV